MKSQKELYNQLNKNVELEIQDYIKKLWILEGWKATSRTGSFAFN